MNIPHPHQPQPLRRGHDLHRKQPFPVHHQQDAHKKPRFCVHVNQNLHPKTPSAVHIPQFTPLGPLGMCSPEYPSEASASSLGPPSPSSASASSLGPLGMCSPEYPGSASRLKVNNQYLATIKTRIHGEMDRISQALAARIRELAERYAEPLPALTSKVAELEAKVQGHLAKMGFEL